MFLPGPRPSARPAAGRCWAARPARDTRGRRSPSPSPNETTRKVGHAGRRSLCRRNRGDPAAAHPGAQAAAARCAAASTSCSPGADGDLADLAGTPGSKAALTDQARPVAPMERLRERWPHTIALDFQPRGRADRPRCRSGAAGRGGGPGRDLQAVRGLRGGAPPDEAQLAGAQAGRGGGPPWRGGCLMRLHILEIQAFGPYAAPHQDRLLTSRPPAGLFLPRRPHRGRVEHDPGCVVTRSRSTARLAGEGCLTSGEDRLQSHFASPGCREPSATLLRILQSARCPLPHHPGARAPAARVARRGVHDRGEPRPPPAADDGRRGWSSPSSNQGRGRRRGHRGGQLNGEAVHPGDAAAAGRVRAVPAGS